MIVFGRTYPVVIIGSGIAGSALAYELEKRGVGSLVCTDQKSPLANTSSLSYGHFRVPATSAAINEVIERSVAELGEDPEVMRLVYSNVHYVIDMLEELRINFECRTFGVIPTYNRRGGKIILERLQAPLTQVATETELVDFTKTSTGFAVSVRRHGKTFSINAQHLVLATGGFAGTFLYNDNVVYKSYCALGLARKNGARLENLDCLFVHPFGYHNGRNILIGSESKQGQFVDSNGEPVFDGEVSNLVKSNKYHEIFPRILEQLKSCRDSGRTPFFIDNKRKLEIVPTVHYTAGGIMTNALGQVPGCDNLYAVGECRADGSKKGGRFPGYAFTAGIVYGKLLAEHLAALLKT